MNRGRNCRLTYLRNLARPIALLLLAARALGAQQSSPPPPSALTLEASVDYALAHYPAVRAAMERQAAAGAGVALARTNYLPRADMLWQANRATRNNIFGLLLPQGVISSISGPVLPTASNDSVWGSAAGMLVSWEPFDFGYRSSLVRAAQARQEIARADTAFTRLDVAAAVAAAFFKLLSAQQVVRAAQADVERRQFLATSVRALVENQLRPGADSSRAEAELAAARIRLIQAQTAERVARASLADLLALPSAGISLDAGSLLQVPPESSLPSSPLASHPAAVAQNATTQLAAAQLRVLDRTYAPRFNLQSSISGRGTGANVDGTFQGGAHGLAPQRENWAAGLTVTFPLLDVFSVRARKQVASAELRAQQARYDQTVQDLASFLEQARALADGARAVAANTPVELRAARDSEYQARARYQAGLASFVEVSEAQALLVQAETEDAVAKLNAWSTLASLAATQGDFQPFFELLRSAGGH